jgi:DNA repair exonuclease SbcCD ATPase subunit
MKLRALELEQFRKFDRKVRIAGFGDRVNVLSGPNEFGKSTILAAIRGLLFERHNSKADAIRRMQNWRGNAAPVLAMEFETGGGLWRIEKRFLSKPMARLTGPGGSQFDDDAAEEELQRLLGFGASGKGGAKPEQMGVWGALWVTQRDSVLQADLSSDIARSTITNCLDAEVGVLTGTESGQALLRAVREQRSQMLDGNGKPRGRYKDVAIALESVTTALSELEARAQRLADDAAELRAINDKLEKESDPAAEQRDRLALEAARRLRETAMVYAERTQRAQSAFDLASRQRDDAQRELATRQARAAELARSGAAWYAAQQKLQTAQQAEAGAQAAYAACRQHAEAAQAEATEAAIAARRLRAVADLVRRSAGLVQYQAALLKAEAEQGTLSDLQARLAAMPVTPECLEAIRRAAREHESAHAVLAAQATQLDIDLDPSALDAVTVGGAGVKAARITQPVVSETEIVIAGIGRIRVTPAIQGREKIEKRIDKAQDALSVALIAAGCKTIAEAETAHAARESVQRNLANARAVLDRLTPGDAASGLAPGIGKLRDHVAILQKRTIEESAAMGLAALPALAEATAAAEAADAADIKARETLQQARTASDLAGDQRSTARDEAARIDGSVKSADTERARLALETQLAETREPAVALAARLDESLAAHERCAAELASLERERPADSVDGMAARIERYEQALQMRAQTVRRLQQTATELRTRIAQEGGHGLDEQIATAKRERDALALEKAAIERDVKILSLLLETLTSAERETKERYLAPVIRRVTPYLRSLFPGAEIACDDALRITGVTRGQSGCEDFDRLSDGTQEQIAVLSRLAFAEMLIDQGKPAMVILDDALAYADAERMERMFDILTQASAKTQILVLTCREDLFSRLGGNRLELTHATPVV